MVDRTLGPRPPTRRVRVAGTPVDMCDVAEFVGLTTTWARDGRPALVVGVNAHVVNVCAGNPAFAAAVAAADLNLPDGQSIVWASRLLGHQPRGRVPLTHTTSAMCTAWAAAALPVYLLGGRPGVARRAADRLAAAYGLVIVGTHDGYFDDTDPDIVDKINASGARILMVGLGNPRQELWVVSNRGRLAPPVVLTCGGWLDWTAGERRPCPGWIYRIGLEWAYRLGQEPRRLFRRYVAGNPAFLWRVAMSYRADRRAGA